MLDEAEPRQHRHLTRAWLAQRQGRWTDASTELDGARGAYVASSPEGGGVRMAEARARTGDHTPHLLVRLAGLQWVGPALDKIETWLQQIDAARGQSSPPPSQRPTARRL